MPLWVCFSNVYQGVTIITNIEPMLPVVRTPVIEQDHRRGRLARSCGGGEGREVFGKPLLTLCKRVI